MGNAAKLFCEKIFIFAWTIPLISTKFKKYIKKIMWPWPEIEIFIVITFVITAGSCCCWKLCNKCGAAAVLQYKDFMKESRGVRQYDANEVDSITSLLQPFRLIKNLLEGPSAFLM